MGGSDALTSLLPCSAMEMGGGHLTLTRLHATEQKGSGRLRSCRRRRRAPEWGGRGAFLPPPIKSNLVANPPQRPLLSETRPPAKQEDTGVMAAICCHNNDIPLQKIREGGAKLLVEAIQSLLGTLPQSQPSPAVTVINTLPWERTEVISLPGPSEEQKLGLVKVPSMGYVVMPENINPCTPVTVVMQDDGSVIMKNEILAANFDSMGRLTSLRLLSCNRESIPQNSYGNQFVMFDDIPLYWDAWDVMDYHLETRKPVSNLLNKLQISSSGGLRGVVTFTLQISDTSTIVQEIILEAATPYIRFNTKEAGIIQSAYNFCIPLLTTSSPVAQPSSWSAFTISSPAVVLETVKMAEKRPDTLVVRLYEAYGSTVDTQLQTSLPVKEAFLCDLLERTYDLQNVLSEDRCVKLSFTPFKVLSVLLVLQR
ncbi:hypothetical protein AB205_0041650 [Aquarana catesbeiana]|uniref:Glycosyl hydrolases family 38 C-terminal beta sandwich domain-containing protein n=1 Tax=Aquarana catesbeiana TaxID=8400 RepID=A0A2G9P8V4_AQUCT|nr:hypothetical protein AB205_0041650 [Aquarana catesbeiana]